MTDTHKILQRSKDRIAEILEHPEFKAYNNMSKRLFALATDNGNRPFNTETVKDGIKKLTPEEKKIREKANNWSNPLKKDSFLHNFEWGKDADKLKRMSESVRAAVLNPLDLARHFDKKIDLTQNKLSHVATLRRSLSKTGPIKRHQKTLDDAKAAQVKKVQNDKSVDETDKKVLENFNEVINESPTKKVNNSATQNKSTKPNEGDSGPTVSENLEAKEKRQQDLVNHRDIISDALDQHVSNRPERMTTQPDIDETKVDKDGLPIIPDEEKESDEAYNARPDVQAWQTRMDELESTFNETSKRLKDEQEGNVTSGVNKDLQLDKPTPQEAGAEAGIEVADFGNQVLDNYDGGVGQLQEDLNAAKGLYKDDKGQFTVEGDPSGPFYDDKENRPMNRAEVGTVLGEDVEPDKESGGTLGRGEISKPTLRAITEEYEKRFGERFPLDSEGRGLSKESETYQALTRAGVFHHDNQPILDKDGNEVAVGKGTGFHKQQSKFNTDRFVPNKKDSTINNDGTNASIDDIYDQIKMVAENPEMFTKTMSKDEIDQAALQALNDYKENSTPENKSKLQAVLTRRNTDTGVETNINQKIERIDQANQKTT